MMRAPLRIVETASGNDPEKIEIDLLLAGILNRYGYDFTHYSRASLKRRLERAMGLAKVTRFTEMLDHLLHDEKCFDEFLKSMSVTVTEMFRDPGFYQSIRETIVPVLKTYPFVKIWHAGCATGEEVYSMALLLHEEGFLDRARIYATDFNKHSLDIAERGIYPTRHVEGYAKNYVEAGGIKDFADYYHAGYEHAKFKDFLKERITFSYHNLVTDGVFGEMNLICCRNVMIYFDKVLQDQVLLKLTDSLRHGGFLCLGNKESLNFTNVKQFYEPVDRKQRIYRKIGVPMPYEAIVVGVSAGGLEALKTILPALPETFSVPVIVVQHRNERTDEFLAKYLDQICKLTVREPEDKEPIRGGHIYIAPGGYHLLVETDKSFSLSDDPA